MHSSCSPHGWMQRQGDLIGEAIAKKVILDQIWPIFGPSLVQIVPKIPKFEKMF